MHSLSFQKHGHGPKKWILFHGFGQDRSVYENWLTHYDESQHTLLLVDLYFHGDSFHANELVSENEWRQAISELLDRNDIINFTLVGFSLGARFSFYTLRFFADRIEGMLLLGPDGFFKSNYYKLSVSRLGNKLFKYMMLHPERLNQFMNIIEKSRITPSTSIRFAKKELSTKPKRKLVYQSWTYFRNIDSSLKDVFDIIEKNNIKVTIILGDQDQVTPIRKIKPQIEAKSTFELAIIPGKHHQLIPNFTSFLPSFLQEENL